MEAIDALFFRGRRLTFFFPFFHLFVVVLPVIARQNVALDRVVAIPAADANPLFLSAACASIRTFFVKAIPGG